MPDDNTLLSNVMSFSVSTKESTKTPIAKYSDNKKQMKGLINILTKFVD